VDVTDRERRWASTMAGHDAADLRLAHADGGREVGEVRPFDRAAREAVELAAGATRAVGAGTRAVDEEPDPNRTCFERDRDRILHSSAFRRLSGKTQVFVFPDDHQRTRLTHALEVAQVATSIARAARLNGALTDAIALGHDCGHGPGGHASEDALSPYVDGGYDHAVWGADVALADLNLCVETLDGIRNHSWSRPTPSTPEGEVVSWADRIAYVCHDFEDAVAAGIVSPTELPAIVRERCGDTRREQLSAFIGAVLDGIVHTGRVGMAPEMADALAAFRTFNYERIYLREASRQQGALVIDVLRALVDHFTPERGVEGAVTYVAGMTDRFAFSTAEKSLGWDPRRLPTLG
jgi:dGTPase